MTDNKFSITPPPELVQQWDNDWHRSKIKYDSLSTFVATQAARWGADQELEACERYWMKHGISPEGVARMREARRPEPPSLKEQALEALENLNGECLLEGFECPEKVATIRRALESLPD